MALPSRRTFLLGGTDINHPTPWPTDRIWISQAGAKPICIVDLTSRDMASRHHYRGVMRRYFSLITQNELFFLSELDDEEVERVVRASGAIYLPGGDPEVLLTEIDKRGLARLICSADCVLAGNSAGAIALCSKAISTADSDFAEPTISNGLGIVNFAVDPHYNPSHDQQLLKLSHGETIYGLPEQSLIAVSNLNRVSFIGPVWRFADGAKQQVADAG
jgi:peptidase E